MLSFRSRPTGEPERSLAVCRRFLDEKFFAGGFARRLTLLREDADVVSELHEMMVFEIQFPAVFIIDGEGRTPFWGSALRLKPVTESGAAPAVFRFDQWKLRGLANRGMG